VGRHQRSCCSSLNSVPALSSACQLRQPKDDNLTVPAREWVLAQHLGRQLRQGMRALAEVHGPRRQQHHRQQRRLRAEWDAQHGARQPHLDRRGRRWRRGAGSATGTGISGTIGTKSSGAADHRPCCCRRWGSLPAGTPGEALSPVGTSPCMIMVDANVRSYPPMGGRSSHCGGWCGEQCLRTVCKGGRSHEAISDLCLPGRASYGHPARLRRDYVQRDEARRRTGAHTSADAAGLALLARVHVADLYNHERLFVGPAFAHGR
jgi:hypothetical protein